MKETGYGAREPTQKQYAMAGAKDEANNLRRGGVPAHYLKNRALDANKFTWRVIPIPKSKIDKS